MNQDNLHPKETLIREKRLILATQNNITGAAGKLGIIAKWLGSPILRQGSGLYDISYLNSYELPEEKGIQDFDDEPFIVKEGYIFDGLSLGMHIEIRYLHVTKQLTCHYKGYLVYSEIAGDLDAYVSFPEWEKMINRLYKFAKEKQKRNNEIEKKEMELKVTGKVKEFFQNLRLRWGELDIRR